MKLVFAWLLLVAVGDEIVGAYATGVGTGGLGVKPESNGSGNAFDAVSSVWLRRCNEEHVRRWAQRLVDAIAW